MATKAQLKTYFETGDKPLSSEFDELIDSCYGTDQQIFFDGTNIRLTRSDGGSDFLANISGHNRQSLTYDTNSRTLNLSGNTASNPVGPILGLWNKAGSPAYLTTDDIYFLNDVGIGAAPSNGYKLAAYGNTWLNGGVRIGYGQTVNDISSDNTLHGTGASNSRLVTEKAIRDYIESRTDKYLFRGELASLVRWDNNPGPIARTIPFTTGGSAGFADSGWQADQNNTYTIPADGWYELGIRLQVDNLVGINDYTGNSLAPNIYGYFSMGGNTMGDTYAMAHYQTHAVRDSMVNSRIVVKLSKDALVKFVFQVQNLPSNEVVQLRTNIGGKKCTEMTIKKLAKAV